MPDICLYAQVHQPYRLARYRVFDVGSGRDYFDAEANAGILRRVADKCYLPANALLTDLIERSGGRFKLALSLSGVLLEQLEAYAPDVLASFQRLVDTGGVELLGETYHHSLASLADPEEFERQVAMHRQLILRLFRRRPQVFRNTELIFWDDLAPRVARLGFRAVLAEGADHVLRGRSPNQVYASARAPALRILPRNYSLSDDVGFRFSRRDWDGWPLTAEKYGSWLAQSPGESVHLFLDYETFGEHQWDATGIFPFLDRLPAECLARGLRFVHPSEAARQAPRETLSYPRPTSWADQERDTTAWLGNRMQQSAHEWLYQVGRRIRNLGDPALLAAWRRLTTSDHVYYMCTKWFADGDVHAYFSPYESPYDAFVAFGNVLDDLERRTDVAVAERQGRGDHSGSAGREEAVA
ncbi:MAG: glycoside hydrolase family 57 protein [Gemmatimonadales bacterium]